MTPAINLARKHKIDFTIHEYPHDDGNAAYGMEAVEKLALPAERVFKTLVVNLDNRQLGVAVVPVSSMLNMKCMAKALGVRKTSMADQADVERVTGYVLGGVSPLGQRKRLPTAIDLSAKAYDTIYVSAGRRGLEIELAPADLCRLVNGKFATLCQ